MSFRPARLDAYDTVDELTVWLNLFGEYREWLARREGGGVMARQSEKAEATVIVIPRSRQLFETGFKTRADAARCIKAIISDLAADRIGAMEANALTDATLGRMRDFDRKAKREEVRTRRKKGGR